MLRAQSNKLQPTTFVFTPMHSHFATSMFEQLQEKNKVSDDEQQNKEQEKDPKPPLNEESAVTTTNTEVKTHKTSSRTYSSKTRI